MMKRMIIFLLLHIFANLSAQQSTTLNFLTRDVEEFINKIGLSNADKQSFRIYFDRLSEKIEATNEQKGRATRQYIYQVAWNNLEKKHRDWYSEINIFFTDTRYTMDESFDPVRNHIRKFLTWYGAYEEYLTVKLLAQQGKQQDDKLPKVEQKTVQHKQNEGFFDSFKSYAHKVKNKMTSWFKTSSKTTHA